MLMFLNNTGKAHFTLHDQKRVITTITLFFINVIKAQEVFFAEYCYLLVTYEGCRNDY